MLVAVGTPNCALDGIGREKVSSSFPASMRACAKAFGGRV